jgi:8-oxo-dGTP diphosphatase
MKEVAVGIIMENGHVLVCQRRPDTSYPLKWEFPGGKIEHGESPAGALKRELLEELGIDAVIGSLFHIQEWDYREGLQSRDGLFRLFYCRVTSFQNSPRNMAFEAIRWVTPEELQQMDILEGNRVAVDLLARHAEFKEKD